MGALLDCGPTFQRPLTLDAHLQRSAVHHDVVDTLDRFESIFGPDVCDIGTGTGTLGEKDTAAGVKNQFHPRGAKTC